MNPVEPQSLTTEYLLPWSHGWLRNWVSRLAKLGSLERSSSWSSPLDTIWGMYTPVGTTMS